MNITKTVDREYMVRSITLHYNKNLSEPFNATIIWEAFDDPDARMEVNKYFTSLEDAQAFIKEQIGVDF